ncbi:protein of unknown function [Pseudomonas sp. JV551A1]|nr:protein of unknown function [Pseudomonas sp. JV551A1]
MGAGMPANQATRWLAPAAPVFAGKPAPTGAVHGLACAIPVGAALAAKGPAQPIQGSAQQTHSASSNRKSLDCCRLQEACLGNASGLTGVRHNPFSACEIERRHTSQDRHMAALTPISATPRNAPVPSPPPPCACR